MHDIGTVEGSTGVEDDHVTRRTGLVGQHRQQHVTRLLAALDTEVAVGSHRQPEILGMQRVFEDLAILEFTDEGLGPQRDLVHAIQSVHHHDVFGTELPEHAHEDADQIGMEDAQQRVGRTRRVGQGAKDVEDGTHAQLLAHGSDVLHRRMMVGRKHEADAATGDRFGHLLRPEVDAGAQCLQHVGCSRARGDTAVAVLGHGTAGSCDDEHRGSGNVEGMGTIATRADDVDEAAAVLHLDRRGELAHDFGGRADFANGLLLDTQAGDDGGGHDGGQLPLHDEPHQLQHLVVEDLAMFDGAQQRVLRGDAHVRHSGNS